MLEPQVICDPPNLLPPQSSFFKIISNLLMVDGVDDEIEKLFHYTEKWKYHRRHEIWFPPAGHRISSHPLSGTPWTDNCGLVGGDRRAVDNKWNGSSSVDFEWLFVVMVMSESSTGGGDGLCSQCMILYLVFWWLTVAVPNPRLWC